jgi:hypothetical protein
VKERYEFSSDGSRRPWSMVLPRGLKDFVFSIADVGYKIWNGRLSCLEVGEKDEEE